MAARKVKVVSVSGIYACSLFAEWENKVPYFSILARNPQPASGYRPPKSRYSLSLRLGRAIKASGTDLDVEMGALPFVSANPKDRSRQGFARSPDPTAPIDRMSA